MFLTIFDESIKKTNKNKNKNKKNIAKPSASKKSQGISIQVKPLIYGRLAKKSFFTHYLLPFLGCFQLKRI